MARSDTITFPANGQRKRLQDRVPLDAIAADAAQASPGRAIQGLIGYVLFTMGWTARKIFVVAFRSGAWCFSAVKMGWRTAAGEALAAPDVRAVMEENRRLRAELARVT
jgi:hypothetical protein